MSNTQIVLYLFALLSIYALAAKLDEQAASTADRPWVRFIGSRCMPTAVHPSAPQGHAASGPLQPARSFRAVC